MKTEREWANEISARLTTARRGQWEKILKAKVTQIRNEQAEAFLQMLHRSIEHAKQQGHQNAVNQLEGLRLVLEEEGL